MAKKHTVKNRDKRKKLRKRQGKVTAKAKPATKRADPTGTMERARAESSRLDPNDGDSGEYFPDPFGNE